MRLADFKDILKTIYTNADGYYVANVPNKKKVIAVYQQGSHAPINLESNFCKIKDIKVLIRWTENPVETEEAAMEIYKKINEINRIETNDFVLHFINLQSEEPVALGFDQESGLYEYIINLSVYYTEKED